MYVARINQTYYGKDGRPYRVEIELAEGTIGEDYWTEAEAWAARDRALDAGFKRVVVIGAPAIVAGGN